jgi:hypothetical protein
MPASRRRPVGCERGGLSIGRDRAPRAAYRLIGRGLPGVCTRSFGALRVLCPAGDDNPALGGGLDAYLLIPNDVARDHRYEGDRRAALEHGVGDHGDPGRVHALEAVAHDVRAQTSLGPGSGLLLTDSSPPFPKVLRPRQGAAGDLRGERHPALGRESGVLVDLDRDIALRFRAPGNAHRGGKKEKEDERSSHYQHALHGITRRSFKQCLLGRKAALPRQ